jgi:hypothetical protein
MGTSTEEIKLRASTVVETLNKVLDTMLPVMRLYPDLPLQVRTDTELAIDAIVRLHHALVRWHAPETPQDAAIQRMRDALQLMARLGREADCRLQSPAPDASMEDLVCWSVLRQFGGLAERALGTDWPDKEDDDADLFA